MSGTPRPPFADWRMGEFAEALADRSPVPGGGAAAGVALAQGAALGSMVVAFSLGKPRHAEHHALLEAAAVRLAGIRDAAWTLADRDASGFEALSGLWSRPKDDPERMAGWPAAVLAAIEPPRDLMRAASTLVSILESLVGRTTPLLRSDLAIAARFTVVAAEAAAWNVEMNLASLAELPDRRAEAASLEAEIPASVAGIRSTADRIDAACRAGGREIIAQGDPDPGAG